MQPVLATKLRRTYPKEPFQEPVYAWSEQQQQQQHQQQQMDAFTPTPPDVGRPSRRPYRITKKK
jgi:hypothetical protein